MTNRTKMLSGLTLLMLAFASSFAKPATSTTATCGDGWTPYKEKCYRLFAAPLSWTSASAQCEANSGHLASVPDRETEDFFVGLAQNFSGFTGSLWLGGYREDDDEEWQWNDGSPWNYTNWAKGEPNNAKGNEHHLELWWAPPLWNDEHGQSRHGYICQKGGERKNYISINQI